MGYYSSVALTIHKNDYLRMIAEAQPYGEDAFRFITKEAEVYGDKDGDGKSPVTLYWSYVKWNDWYFHGGKYCRCSPGYGACCTENCLEPAEILPGDIKLSFEEIFNNE